MTTSALTRIATVGLTGLALTGIAVYPQLSARLTGDEITLRVAPVDPIDPFRGAYVDLQYPDLNRLGGRRDDGLEDGRRGDLFITLRQEGDVWVTDGRSRTRPDSGPYLACTDQYWEVRCGIESWFLPQEDAAAMQASLGDGALATVKVDSRGHAAIVAIEG